MTGKLTRM